MPGERPRCRAGFPLGLLLACLSGCTGGHDGGGADGGMVAVEVGGGEYQFEPLVDDQTVELIMGSQGGYHVWVSLRATGVDPRGVGVRFSTVVLDRPGSETHSTLAQDLDPVPGVPDAYQYVGWPAVQPEPGCVDGHPLEVRVDLVDSRRRWGSDARRVVPMASVPVPDCP